MRFRLAAGFNYAYERAGQAGLKYHPEVELVEMGIPELRKLGQSSVSARLQISLHLSRAPITEHADAQAAFIEHVEALLAQLALQVRDRVTSIGLHLTGSRYEGIGLLGGAERFRANAESESRAKQFIERLRARTALPVWLENANIYSANAEDVLASWHATRRIVEDAGADIIVDLAHLIAESHNIELDPRIVLGAIPWARATEIHLSGIREGADGKMHDGHGFAIHDQVWNLLPQAMALAEMSQSGTVWINVEHTPPSWAEKADLLRADFDRVALAIRTARPAPAFMADTRQYMLGYLKYIIRGQIPLLEPALAQRNLSLDGVLGTWIREMESNGRRIIFDADEVAAVELGSSAVLTHEFLGYAKRAMHQYSLRPNDVAH
jgi:uncharacterized protein (UPF0276 family)